jgi:HEAT repeat protein
VIAVGRIGGEGAHAALRRALDSEHGEVRFQAGPALVELRGEDARTEVLVLLADERPTVRANAVRALAELAPHAPTAARFARLLEDPDREVRLEAALALEDDARALPVLRAALASGALPEEDLFRVLDGLGRRGDVAALPLVHRLATSLLKPRPVKAAAAAALARMNDPRGVALLRPFLVGLRADQRDFVLGVVGALGLTELAPEVRSLLARPAGASPESLAAALVALADRDPTLREEERRALGRGDAFAEALRAARAAAEEAREHDGP